MDERRQLKEAIAVQESLRGSVDDAIIDATIATLREKLATIEVSPMPDQQRKLITLLFTDIVGSTTMVRDMDPEDNMELMDGALKRMGKVVEEHSGRVTRYMGDGFKAVFGAPLARENDAEMAVRAGLGILAKAEEIAEEVEKEWGIIEFQVRVGVNTGLAALGGETEAEDTIMGSMVNLGARLESAAPAGGLLISYETYNHVRGLFEVEPLPPIKAKGFEEPMRVYLVKQAKARKFRMSTRGVEGTETRMVGRETELKHLQDALFTAMEEGEGQMVTIAGEAGVGKSRLLYEFQNWIEERSQKVCIFEGRSIQETRNIPYSLQRDIFSTHFQIKESDKASQVRDKVEAGFMEQLGDDEEGRMRAHIIGQLLGFDFHTSQHLKGVLDDPQQLRDRGLIYLEEYFQAAADQDICAVFLDDIHWADDSSLDAIDQLGRKTPEQPLVIVCLARHRLFEQRPYWGEGQPYHSRLNLLPLTKRESRQLVCEILEKVEEMPQALRDLVVEGAEGNPYYIEELIKMLIEEGVIVRKVDKWVIEQLLMAETSVPSTLMGVLQARLDSLPPLERTTLQKASVVGRVFWDNTVEFINKETDEAMDGEIGNSLAELRGKEMVYRRERSAFSGSEEYTFKHSILRDVTYESVLKRARKVYHGLIADWLIDHCGERVNEYTGLIADHLELAGRKEAAIHYLRQAGDQAVSQYANEEAIGYYQRALNLISALPSDKEKIVAIEPRLRESLGDVFGLVGKHEGAKDSYQNAVSMVPSDDKLWNACLHRKLGRNWQDQGIYVEAESEFALAESLLDLRPDVSPAEWWQEWIWIQIERLRGYYARAKPDEISELVEKIQPIVEQYGIPQQHAAFYSGQALLYFRRDRYVVTEELLDVSQKLLSTALAIGENRRLGKAYFELGFALLWYGDLDEAEAAIRKALKLTDQSGDLYFKTLCFTYLAILYRKRGLVKETQEFTQFSLASATERQMINYISTAKANQAWVSWREGNSDEAEVYGKEALDLWGQVPFVYPFQWTALWPLIAITVEKSQLDQTLVYVRALLEPDQQYLPGVIEECLQKAIHAWEEGKPEVTHSKLEEALELAKEFYYL